MTAPDCSHEVTSPVAAGHVCESCGEVLERPALRGVDGSGRVLPKRRQLEFVRQVRRSLRPEDGDR